jgi:hypothetical protein
VSAPALDLIEAAEALWALIDRAAVGPAPDPREVAGAVYQHILAGADPERGALLAAAVALAVDARLRSRELYR